MKFDEFMGKVQNLAALGTTGDTLKAVRATLEVLSQRLVRGEAADLAAQLPSEIQEYLVLPGGAERFGVEEFFRRVAEKEGVSPALGEKHARAVIAVITEAVSSGEIKDVLSELPKEFHALFTPASAAAGSR